VRVKKGDRAAMFYPSANRDETRFADPDRFEVSPATRTSHSAAVERISASARTWPG
jgi:cytochrome P450